MRIRKQMIVSLVTVFMALAMLSVAAQSKKESKAAVKFRSQGEQARKSVESVRGQLEKTLKAYEDLLGATDKKLQSAHKKLTGEIASTGKVVESARKSVQEFQTGAEGFFAAWESNLDAISTESIRDASSQRLEAARGSFQSMSDNLVAAREAYDPLMSSLQEQATLLNQDLSADTVAMMGEGPAADVRANGEQVLASLDRILNNEKMEEDAVAEILDEEVESESDAIVEDEGEGEGEAEAEAAEEEPES